MCIATDLLNEYDNAEKKIKKTYTKYSNMLSEYDKKIQDIMHKIEFTKFNASDGYKLCKLLKDTRIERRKIKNEYVKLQKLNHMLNKKSNGAIRKRLNQTNQLQDNLTYTPRVLDELFEEGI